AEPRSGSQLLGDPVGWLPLQQVLELVLGLDNLAEGIVGLVNGGLMPLMGLLVSLGASVVSLACRLGARRLRASTGCFGDRLAVFCFRLFQRVVANLVGCR